MGRWLLSRLGPDSSCPVASAAGVGPSLPPAWPCRRSAQGARSAAPPVAAAPPALPAVPPRDHDRSLFGGVGCTSAGHPSCGTPFRPPPRLRKVSGGTMAATLRGHSAKGQRVLPGPLPDAANRPACGPHTRSSVRVTPLFPFALSFELIALSVTLGTKTSQGRIPGKA